MIRNTEWEAEPALTQRSAHNDRACVVMRLMQALNKDKSMSIQARVTLYIGFTHAGVNVVFLISFCSTPPSM